MADKYSPRTDAEQLIVDSLLEVAVAQSSTLPNASTVRAALSDVATGELLSSLPIAEVLRDGGRGAALLYEFDASLMRALNETRASAGIPKNKPPLPRRPLDGPEASRSGLHPSGLPRRVPRMNLEAGVAHRAPEDMRGRLSNLRRGIQRGRSIESANEALKRAAEPEIVNEILAGGAVAASFTAGASVAKAKLEATTQRRKNELDAETERLRIASDERIAGMQTVRAQVEPEGPEGEQ
ncbi:hypothetical protein ACFRLW_27470 [Streptomyces sp. NPDC056728]